MKGKNKRKDVDRLYAVIGGKLVRVPLSYRWRIPLEALIMTLILIFAFYLFIKLI